MSSVPDLTGQVFGRWTVLGQSEKRAKGQGKGAVYWDCLCECGVQKPVNHRSLERQRSLSCGCLSREINSNKVPVLDGQKFGRWTVLGRDCSQTGGNINSRQNCLCECGNQKSVATRNLLSGESRSCGCLHSEITSSIFAINIAGQRFGRWTAIEKVQSPPKSTMAHWLCRCDCGENRVVKAYSLRSGLSKSCGCLHKEIVQQVGYSKKTHGETGDRLHRIWSGMKGRCNNPENHAYKNYGGRGIKVTQEWTRYEDFRDWALENGYEDDLTIERIDVNGNYCPENCCFIPRAAQGKNKRNTIYLTVWGETKSLSDWMLDSRCAVKNVNTIRTRYSRGKLTPEEMLSTPAVRVKITV